MSDPFILRAKTLITQGQKAEARRLLHDYVGLYGNNVDAWLLLAAISSPQASLEYVYKALAIDPESAVAKRALGWATARAAKIKLELPSVAEANPEPKPPAATVADLQEALNPTRPPVPPRPARPLRTTSKPKPTPTPGLLRRFFSPIAIIPITAFISLCLVAGFLIVNNTRANAIIPRYVAQLGDLEKATLTYTPTFTPTFTPTLTNTPTNTPTPTPTNTLTPSATFTFTPTFTPTDTPSPTNTPILPTVAPPAATVAAAAPAVTGATGRWIEINLTNQTLTAWQGDTAVNTFVISSGKWNTQTLPGTFHIYIKLRVARMIGIDYDTPDVPYTMYYDGNFAIHGAYWHNSFGTPVSHGCVNMRVNEAGWLFDWASVGTMVNVHY